MESVSFPEPPPLIGTPKKQDLNKLCDYHGDRGHNTNDCYQLKKQIKEVVALEKLAHLVKDISRNNQRNGNQKRNGVKVINMIRVEGRRKRPFRKGKSGMMNELTFPAIPRIRQKSCMKVEVRDSEGDQNEKPQSSRFYHLLHDQILTNQGVVTMETSREALRECKHLERVQDVVQENMEIDYSGLNKACAKDMYPLPEEGEELASLMGYPYKCFLQLPKEYSQIRMAEEDDEKIGFHTEEGVYCFTHMPKELKNSATTLQRMMEKDQKEIRKVTNVGHPKRRRRSNAMSTAKKRDNKLRAIGREGRNPDTCILFFRNHKVKVVIDGPMEETLKISGRERRLGKWATEIRTYDISYVQRKEVEGPVIRKFFGQGEQGLEIIPRLEEIEEGLGIKIILASPEEKMYLYAIRLKFKASSYAMDYEALLAGLAASANQGMKDLHVFIDSLTLVAQVEGNHTLATKQERRYKKEIMDATVPFYRFRVTHLLKILNLKAEVLTGLATINLEYLNQEVSIGIKTRPSVEDTSSSKKGKTTNNAPEIKPKCTREASGSK
ncbi:reverse transcriptase domain-containing protein [Tanacetum coccineum]